MPSLPRVKNLAENTTPGFRAKLYRIATELNVPPGELAALMGFESRWTFSPSVKNPSGGATGLIQFMPDTAKRLGTTTADLAKMSGFQQLDYVQKYLARMGKWRIPGDTYLMVFWPSGVGKPDDYLIGEKGNMSLVPGAQFSRNKVYEQNKGLDSDGNGRITAGDVRKKVLTVLSQSEKAGTIDVTLDDEARESGEEKGAEASPTASNAPSVGLVGAVAAAIVGAASVALARAFGWLK